MSEVQLPKAGWLGDIHGYSESQLKQYGDDRAREALEMAANRVGVWDKSFNTGGTFAGAIRALTKEIK